MKKLIEGIVEFRKQVRPQVVETFAKLALGQSPDTLFIACSDSRVVPNLFASTDPGDLFVVRNVGNMIPPTDRLGVSMGDESEASAIEFAVLKLGVKEIIVCGHSECGAMQALCNGRENVKPENLRSWLRHADACMDQNPADILNERPHEKHNQISQLNVLEQLKHIKTYPCVKEKMKNGELRLHGWWFELSGANVYAYEEDDKKFVLIDETEAQRILKKLS